MPRDANEAPPLNPSPRAANMVHFDNTQPNRDPEFRGTATQVAESKSVLSAMTPAGNNSDAGNQASNATVTVKGDFEGSQSVTPNTDLMEVLAKINPDFTQFSYKRLDDSDIALDYKVTGDLTVVAKKKEDAKQTPPSPTSTSINNQGANQGTQSANRGA